MNSLQRASLPMRHPCPRACPRRSDRCFRPNDTACPVSCKVSSLPPNIANGTTGIPSEPGSELSPFGVIIKVSPRKQQRLSARATQRFARDLRVVTDTNRPRLIRHPDHQTATETTYQNVREGDYGTIPPTLSYGLGHGGVQPVFENLIVGPPNNVGRVRTIDL